MSFVDVARGIVLRTNRSPGFKGIYQELYDLALTIATRRLQSVPDVLAVMLRVGEDGRKWTPGLSDYDLTVLTERSDTDRMMHFLEALWGRYQRIKSSIPQLGEMEVMNVVEYGDFLSFGPMPTASLKRADPLFVTPGRGDLEAVLQQEPRPSREREFLLDALSRYIRFFFPAWLHHAGGTSDVARRRADHLLENVLKRLRHLEGAVGATPAGSLDDRILRSFGDLSRACSKASLGSDENPASVETGSWEAVKDAIPPVQAFASEALRDAEVSDCSVILWISYMSGDKLSLVFVVPDDIPDHELSSLVTTLARLYRRTEGLWSTVFTNGELQRYFPSLGYPLVVSRSMWRCWRELSPFDGAAVAATGRTLSGPEDALEGVPSMAALRRGAEIQYAALLPLKNNWRTVGLSGAPRLYAAMMDHVRGYASATSGTVLTTPVRSDFQSAQDGYQAVSDELEVLRESLTG